MTPTTAIRRLVTLAAVLVVSAYSCQAVSDSDATHRDGSGRGYQQLDATGCIYVTDTADQIVEVAAPVGSPASSCVIEDEPAPTTPDAPPVTEAPTTTAAPTTTQAPTTTVAPATGFFESFDTAASLDRFDFHVFHRNIDVHDFSAFSGGAWPADHADLGNSQCDGPQTQRTMTFDADDDQATRIANAVYWCDVPPVAVGANHMMTTMGDVDGYSIVTFSPDQTFDAVESVCFDVNLTDLGSRQWWKIGVVSEARYNSSGPNGVPGYLVSDVAAADLPTSLDDGEVFVASWGGGLSGGANPNGLKIGNQETGAAFEVQDDIATRYPVCLTDNGEGTVTFDVATATATAPGAFPAGPVRVVFYDNNYTPDKAPAEGHPFDTYTWHLDNFAIN